MELVDKLIKGDQVTCAQCISMVENEEEGYIQFLKEIHKYTGRAEIIGFTGPPGGGKSTLVDGVVKLLRKENKKVGVVAVDPTSPFTHGAILGDRVRMGDLNLDPGVFIRSMGTRGSLGGISKATQGAINILDAYGCDVILVETVGVGQSEIDIVKTADTVVMVMVPGLGDDIQAIKAGTMEIGDIFVVNKADNDQAEKTCAEIEMMLNFKKDWLYKPPVLKTIASENKGIDVLLENIENHQKYLKDSGKMKERRFNRSVIQIRQFVKDTINKKLDKEIEGQDERIKETIQSGDDLYAIGFGIMNKILK